MEVNAGPTPFDPILVKNKKRPDLHIANDSATRKYHLFGFLDATHSRRFFHLFSHEISEDSGDGARITRSIAAPIAPCDTTVGHKSIPFIPPSVPSIASNRATLTLYLQIPARGARCDTSFFFFFKK